MNIQGATVSRESRIQSPGDCKKNHLGERLHVLCGLPSREYYLVCFRSFGNLRVPRGPEAAAARSGAPHENPESKDTSSGLASPLTPFQRAPFQTHCNTVYRLY